MQVLLILWPTRVEPACEEDGMEWLLPPPRFTPLSSTSTSSPNLILSKETTIHIILVRVREENGVQPGWGYKEGGSCLTHVLKDSTDKWEASKVSLEPSPFSFPFSPSSVLLSLA